MGNSNMSNYLISVIIPVYNREKYLDRCIQSVLNQKSVQTQIILVDDGSTDKSPEILDNYAAQNKNIVVVHKANQGAAIARNTALDLVTGDYITFLDSDDYLEPDSLISLYEALVENDVDMVIGNADIYEESGQLSETTIFTERYQNKKISSRDAYSMVVDLHNVICSVIWARLYKKDVWNGVRFPEMRKREDNYIMPLILENCKSIYTLDKIVYNQILSSKSIMRSSTMLDDLKSIDAYLYELDYLTQKDYYDIARYRFGQATRLLLECKRNLNDKESNKIIQAQYNHFKAHSKKLSSHANKKDKLRYSLFRTNLTVYDYVRKMFATA